VREANGCTAHFLGAGIGRHDQYHVAEVCLAAIVICQGAVVHDLQQQIKDIRVCFFDLIQKQYHMRVPGDGFRQQTALVITDVSGWCTNQAGYGMAFHVLGHIKSNQFQPHDSCQLARDFCFTDTGGA